MQKPMIHWLLHSIGDSHVMFVTLSSRTYVISSMLVDQTLGWLPTEMFFIVSSSFCSRQLTSEIFTPSRKDSEVDSCADRLSPNLIRMTPLKSKSADTRWHTYRKQVFSWLNSFVSREVKGLELVSRCFCNCVAARVGSDLEFPNTCQQMYQAPFWLQSKDQQKQLQLVISPGLLLTTWLIGTTSPEQRDEHQPRKQSFYKQTKT